MIDSITGIEGVLTARVEHLSGLIQYRVEPWTGSAGGTKKERWIDEDRLFAEDRNLSEGDVESSKKEYV